MATKKSASKSKSKPAKPTVPEDEYTEQPQAAAMGDSQGTATAEPEAAPAVDPKPAKTAKSKGAKAKTERDGASAGAATLYDVAEGYLAALDKDGAGSGTLASYGMELKTAMKALGESTPVASITSKQVAEYFASPAVTRTRTNKPKAKPTIDKTRRVLRLALLWAQDEKLVEVAPIPPAPAKAS